MPCSLHSALRCQYSECVSWLCILISPTTIRQGALRTSLCEAFVHSLVSFTHDNFGRDAFSLLKPPKSWRTKHVEYFGAPQLSFEHK